MQQMGNAQGTPSQLQAKAYQAALEKIENKYEEDDEVQDMEEDDMYESWLTTSLQQGR